MVDHVSPTPLINSSGLTKDKYQVALDDTSMYGPHRVSLASNLMPYLNAYQDLVWFLDSGTLLGAHRNGQMLLHDDDFDIGFYLPKKDIEYLHGISNYLTKAGFTCRVVDSYSTKVEVYVPEHGKYVLESRDSKPEFHNVTVDITMFVDIADSDTEMTFLHDHAIQGKIRIDLDTIDTITELEYEGYTWPVPGKTEKFLTSIYGYIGSDAYYNPETCRYLKKDATS